MHRNDPCRVSCSRNPLNRSFFFYSSGDHRDLHSFPTRRSSDLGLPRDVPQCHLHRSLRERIEFDDVIHRPPRQDRKSTRLNSSHSQISYAVFCLKKKNGLKSSLSSRVQSKSTQTTSPAIDHYL